MLMDHPRPCGENMSGVHGMMKQMGSPPPMRGKLGWLVLMFIQQRITPAHAGKTEVRDESVFVIQDHPRPCGENRRIYKNQEVKVGSPPPMRGKLAVLVHAQLNPGITPAHAGKTLKIVHKFNNFHH